MESQDTIVSSNPEKQQPSFFQKVILQLVKARDAPFEFVAKNQRFTQIGFNWSLFLLYNVYLGWCIYRAQDDIDAIEEWQWCDGIGFLIIITSIVYLGLFYYIVFIPYFGKSFEKAISKPIGTSFTVHCMALNSNLGLYRRCHNKL